MPDIFYFFFLVQINCCKKLMLRKMETKERTSIASMNPVSLSLRVFRYFFRKLNQQSLAVESTNQIYCLSLPFVTLLIFCGLCLGKKSLFTIWQFFGPTRLLEFFNRQKNLDLGSKSFSVSALLLSQLVFEHR